MKGSTTRLSKAVTFSSVLISNLKPAVLIIPIQFGVSTLAQSMYIIARFLNVVDDLGESVYLQTNRIGIDSTDEVPMLTRNDYKRDRGRDQFKFVSRCDFAHKRVGQDRRLRRITSRQYFIDRGC
jgi:hypothetical protein